MILDLAFKITNQQNMKTFFKIVIILLPFILVGIFAKDSVRITNEIQKEFVDSFTTAKKYYQEEDAFFDSRKKYTWEYLNLLVRKRPEILYGEAQIQVLVMNNKLMEHYNALGMNELDFLEEDLVRLKLVNVALRKSLGDKVKLTDNEINTNLNKSKEKIQSIRKKADSLDKKTLLLKAESMKIDTQIEVKLAKIDKPETYLTPTVELTWGINRPYLFPLFLILFVYALVALILWACFLTKS